MSLNPILKVLLLGVHDENCVFHKLAGVPKIFRLIWALITQEWTRCIKVYPKVQHYVLSTCDHGLDYDPTTEHEEGALVPAADKFHRDITFPPFQGININMMPFVISHHFEQTLLPAHLKAYFDLIIQACYETFRGKEFGRIGYLTIHESVVKAGETQRRPGIHIDKSRAIWITEDDTSGAKSCRVAKRFGGEAKRSVRYVTWGAGHNMRKNGKFHGGIYIASNMRDSTRAWNCKILDPSEGEEIIGPLGDISHLREFLPEGEILDANRLYWITDRTPHEAMPASRTEQRQFFRLVTSNVSIWYREHSTPNPLLEPDEKVTKIIDGNKFS